MRCNNWAVNGIYQVSELLDGQHILKVGLNITAPKDLYNKTKGFALLVGDKAAAPSEMIECKWPKGKGYGVKRRCENSVIDLPLKRIYAAKREA
jgi:hypothetical protein